MTEKENYFKLLRGEQPDWIPRYTVFISKSGKGPVTMVAPSLFWAHHAPGTVAKDCWGVTYVPVESAGGAKIPQSYDFVLKDIRDWRKVIRLPDISEIDFETEAKEQLAGIDRNETAVMYDLNCGLFQLLMSLMGFTEGLCAMFEEPDEVKALFDYLNGFIYEVNARCVDLYKPDMFALVDDTATWRNPFISLDMFRDLLKPFYAVQFQLAKERGCGVDIHNCGRCEDFIEDWFDLGIVSWNPAQTSNDLVGIKKRYGNSLILEGCWNARDELLDPNVSEQTVKDSIKRTFDTFAPGGGYMFTGSFLGPVNDAETIKKNRWILEAYETYGRTFYQR